MGKNQDPDPRSESGLNIPDHISECLETIFWVKIPKFFDADPESFRLWIRDGKKFGTATLLYKQCFGYGYSRYGLGIRIQAGKTAPIKKWKKFRKV
jgi:hypothetical protein